MNERIERIKEHVRENKHLYGYGAMTIAIGVLIKRSTGKTIIINNVAPIFNNLNKTSLGGHLRKIIYCIELDKYYESVTEAAVKAGVGLSVMSKHLNGHTDDVMGLHYKIVGVSN